MLESAKRFPCPVCAKALDVRQSKKHKPYVVCEGCGIQIFVRGADGIATFNRLVDRASNDGIWQRLSELEKRYRVKCAECGKAFWIERRLIKTSRMDGSFKGFNCPAENCEGVAEWNQTTKAR
jgi:DNA-directed RNA polymerase subunit RPC12/RpoP